MVGLYVKFPTLQSLSKWLKPRLLSDSLRPSGLLGGKAQDQERPQPLVRALRRRKLFCRFIPSSSNGSGCDVVSAIPRVSTKPVVYFGSLMLESMCQLLLLKLQKFESTEFCRFTQLQSSLLQHLAP